LEKGALSKERAVRKILKPEREPKEGENTSERRKRGAYALFRGGGSRGEKDVNKIIWEVHLETKNSVTGGT